MTFGQWVGLAISVLFGGIFIFIPISTIIDNRRARNGKGHLYKGKLRDIVIVKNALRSENVFRRV